MKKIVIVVAVFIFLVTNQSMAKANAGALEKEAVQFIETAVAKLEPVLKEDALAYWQATTTGDEKWYKKYEDKELEIKEIFSDKSSFKKVKALLKKKDALTPLTARQIEILYIDYLENQIDPKLNEDIVRRASALEKKFNVFRAKVGGKEIMDNQIRETLVKSTDQKKRQAVWEASKQVGALVSKDLIGLVKQRNRAARELGFKNYYVMSLEMQEQTEKELFTLLDDLARKTDKPYNKLKVDIDTLLAKRFGIKPSEVRPWHYEDVFFQDAPQVYNVDLDKYLKGKNILKIVSDYYKRLGMPIDDILKKSDLYERKGKVQHAYCINIDRKKDIRVLANVKNDENWTSTMLHELGHSAYDKNLDSALPYLLRDAAHIFTTEGIAELFGKQTSNPKWLESVVSKKDANEIKGVESSLRQMQRAKMLIFARWVMVMANFERSLYANPDQDLNGLWWKLVEKYQLVKKPAGWNNPDWAAKIHLTSAPVYYHNYLLGEVFASQLVNYITKNIGPSDEALTGDKRVGEYLKAKVFTPGDKWRWDKFVKFATGEKLTAKYFAEQYIH